MYVAAKGGEEAIIRAEALFRKWLGEVDRAFIDAVGRSMPYLVDRVMGESSLYAPELAALALTQTGGDLSETVLLLRAYRTTLERIGYARVVTASEQRVVRRISAAFKDIPGGQILGPTLDYSHRLLDTTILDSGSSTGAERELGVSFNLADLPQSGCPDQLPFVTEWEKKQGWLDAPPPPQENEDPDKIPDLTKEPLLIPAPRAHRLQALARGDTGGILTLGYSNMRGYGPVHPTVNEIRLSHADLIVKHPVTGADIHLGPIRMSQGEVVSTFSEKQTDNKLNLGFCATFGWNEIKVIAGSMLDMAMDLPEPHASQTEEYVLYHTESVESSGFCIHYKLPHYVTFNSTVDNLRRVSQNPPKQTSTHETT